MSDNHAVHEIVQKCCFSLWYSKLISLVCMYMACNGKCVLEEWHFSKCTLPTTIVNAVQHQPLTLYVDR